MAQVKGQFHHVNLHIGEGPPIVCILYIILYIYPYVCSLRKTNSCQLYRHIWFAQSPSLLIKSYEIST